MGELKLRRLGRHLSLSQNVKRQQSRPKYKKLKLLLAKVRTRRK